MSDFEFIAIQSMQSVWNRTPRPFQLKLISYVISMRCNPKTTEATLLAQRSRSDEPSTHENIGTIDADVVLVVETTAIKIRQE